MDPNYNPSLYDYVSMCNVDDEPFDLIYNSQNYARIEPLQVIKLPQFLVDHGLKHLIDRILNKQNIPTNNKVERDKLAARIIVGVEVPNRPVALTEDQRIKNEIEQMNPKSDLDNILEKSKSKLEPSNPVVSVSTPGEVLLDEEGKPITDNLPINPPAPVAPQIVPPPSAVPSVNVGTGIPVLAPAIDDSKSAATMTQENSAPAAPTEEPSREALYTYAEGTMKMDLSDEKTKAALDKMSIPELKDTLQWQPPLPKETATGY